MVLGYHIFAAVHKFFEVNVLGGCLKVRITHYYMSITRKVGY